MALSPPKPDLNDPEDIKRYERDLADKEKNPHKWGLNRTPVSAKQANKILDSKKEVEIEDAELIDFEKMTKPELLKYAEKHNVKVDPKARKSVIIDLLK